MAVVLVGATTSLNSICNEYCGIGHHNMLARVIVTDPNAATSSGEQP
jgi:heme/copper-type cytochrome/quinol oxidase subunit 2